MTARVRVRQTDLSNAAKIAKAEGVSIRLVVDGMVVHVDPQTFGRPVAPRQGDGKDDDDINL